MIPPSGSEATSRLQRMLSQGKTPGCSRSRSLELHAPLPWPSETGSHKKTGMRKSATTLFLPFTAERVSAQGPLTHMATAKYIHLHLKACGKAWDSTIYNILYVPSECSMCQDFRFGIFCFFVGAHVLFLT